MQITHPTESVLKCCHHIILQKGISSRPRNIIWLRVVVHVNVVAAHQLALLEVWWFPRIGEIAVVRVVFRC